MRAVTAAQPVTYVWHATDLDTVTHAARGLDDTATFAWTTPGPKTITVTASNVADTVSETHTITIGSKVYLPIVLLTGSSKNSVGFSRPTGPYNRVADKSRAKELLDWEPKVSFWDGLERTIDWYFATKNMDEVKAPLNRMLTER